MKRVLILIAGLAQVIQPVPAATADATASAELTRTAEPGAPRPAARLDELGWLIGTWQGEGIGGNPAMESWTAPIGGTMPGLFVQTDGKGGTMFSEYMQIAPDGDSLIVRLKHFNADLTGWEEKDKTVNFPLVARSADALYFNGLTYQRQGRNGLLVAVRMRKADGGREELIFRFRRVR